MKQLFLLKSKLLIIFIALSLIYCSKVKDNEVVNPIVNQDLNTPEARFAIYWAHWDWARESRNCNSGFGICNFVDCWFCCIDEFDNIVDCNSSATMANAGTIYIPENEVEGTMIVKLDPVYSIHQEAIDQQKDLYVDYDEESESFILHSGVYQFNPEIGNFGGYELNVTKK
jgi:hypothetical protein